MRLQMSLARQTDFDQMVPLAFRAFQDDNFTPIFFGYESPATRKHLKASWVEASQGMNDHWVKVEDLSHEEIDVAQIESDEQSVSSHGTTKVKQRRIVGAANWRIQPIRVPYKGAKKDSSSPEAQSKMGEEFPYLLTRQQRLDASTVLTEYTRGRQLACQEPHILCLMLFVEPGYQRKGIGRALMHWGIDVANKLWLPMWVDSSPQGQGLYRSLGFEERGSKTWETESFGKCESLLMRRETLAKDVTWSVEMRSQV